MVKCVKSKDWDDTLCPTSWIFDQIRRCADNRALLAVERQLGTRTCMHCLHMFT